ncbi:hypothetical protein DFP73DRAFT_601620 [Morchella snyderi]|nr:hypothetical protein DFP73DRAFT_601620 [Morchella snyderi]
MSTMQYPTAKMTTKSGTLKAPPYLDEAQRMSTSGFLKPAAQAEILTKQYDPAQARKDFPPPGPIKKMSNRDIEKALDKYMTLSSTALVECQLARNMIEVFFEIDLDSPTSKKKTETLQGKSLEEIETTVNNYTSIDLPPGAFHVALDSKFRRLFVYFNKGLEIVYGPEIGQWVLNSTTWNIDEYSQIHPPEMPKDKRHINWKDWLLSNPHLCWAPWSRAGVYHWGCWMELGHAYKGSCITKDVANIPSRIQPVLSDLFKSFGNVTRAQRILLGAVDKQVRDETEAMIKSFHDGKKKQWATDEKDCFSLRACLINVFTEPHYDGGDLTNGWACMVPMGEFRGGDLCIRELGRRYTYQPGGIGFIRGSRLEHCTAKWNGIRFSLLATFHENVKQELEAMKSVN